MSLTKNQLRTLAGIATTVDGDKLLTEASQKDGYDSSADFTAELLEVQVALEKIERILYQQKFKKWVELTDENFDTECEDKLNDVFGDLDHFRKSFDEFNEEIDRAQ